MYASRAEARHEVGDYDRAVADFSEAMRLAPSSPTATMSLVGRGRALTAQRQYDQALADYDQAIRRAPQSASAFAQRGMTLFITGNFDRAIADLDQSIRLYPESVFAFTSRGLAHEGKKNFDQAKRDYAVAISLRHWDAEGGWAKETASERLNALKNGKPFAESEEEGANAVKEFDKENPGFSALSSIVMEILPTVVKAHPSVPMKQKLQIAFDQAKRISQNKGKTEAEPSISTGTGFFVSSEGHVLTNAHVVKGCTTAQVAQPGGKSEAARIVATDATNDLALLSVKWRPATVPNLKSGVRTGEDIATFGYPHAGMLPTTGNVTYGNVSATAGLGDDSRMLQISAAVQSGNSGGPVMDQSGNVVGVVVAKLNVLKAFKETGDLPQNVNFAIKASVARTFLETNGVADATPKPSTAVLSKPDLADAAKQFTVFIACKN